MSAETAGAQEVRFGMVTEEYVNYMKMWSKRYLQRIRSSVHTIAMIRSEIAELDDMKDGIGAVRFDSDRVSAQPDGDAILRRIEMMDNLKAELQDELEENLQWQSDAHRALAMVSQPWRALLVYRYLEGKTWADVTIALRDEHGLYYSGEYVRKEMHDKGLVELFPYVPHEYDDLPGAI